MTHIFEVWGILFDEDRREYAPSRLIRTISIPEEADEDFLLVALGFNPRDYGLGKARNINGVEFDIVLGPEKPVLLLRQLPNDVDTMGDET